MDPYAERLARSEPYVNDEPPRFVPLADLEPVEVALTPAANPYGGGSAIPGDTAAPVARYFGGSFSDVAPAPTQYGGGAALVTDVEPQPRTGRFVCGGREAPIGQAAWLLGGLARERAARVIAPARRPRRRGAGRPRATASRSSARSGDSGDSDPAGPPAAPPWRRFTVDDHFCVIALEVVA